jgi:hypothetical protein
MLWIRIVVFSGIIAGRTQNWITTRCQDDRALLRNIQRKLLEDRSSIFQLAYVIGILEITNPDVMTRVEKITMTNHLMSSVVISQAVSDVPEAPSISPTTVRWI